MSWKFILISFIFIILTCNNFVWARKHHLEVKDDIRPFIALSTFGFYTRGHLDVKLSNLYIDGRNKNDRFGLSLDKTTIDQMNPYLDSHQSKCILEEEKNMQRSGPILFFILDLENLIVNVQCSAEWKNLHIYNDQKMMSMLRGKRNPKAKLTDSSLFLIRQRRNAPPHDDDDIEAPYNEDDISGMQEGILEGDKSTKIFAGSIPAETNDVSITIIPPTQLLNAVNNTIKVSTSPTPEIKSELKQKEENLVNSEPIDVEEKEKPALPELKDKMPVEETFEEIQIPNDSQQINICKDYSLPLTKSTINGLVYYNMSFLMFVASLVDEGLYNLYFHACPNYKENRPVSFNVDIIEINDGNFLSAGEMPLPALYFMMSILFFLSGIFWVFILKKSKHSVYKIHYIMAVLVFLKSLSLMFHSIYYHFIEIKGEHVEAWAILFYITHLLKGAVLFITIVLIGTGWTFIKHILSDKDKKIFMIVIPLQVLANVAEIIIDTSEESDVEFRTWRHIFTFVDLLCCGAILFPIVWSIRHLNEASATDGKAAINLRKLKLFRQFYIMIVCYIYFTRIIVYLLKMTVAFQYEWLDEMFHEMATYVFFVLTGYKFRPASSHPYFALNDQDQNDVNEVEVLTESGLTEGLHRTKAQNRLALQSTTTIIEGNDDERENLITKRESSHEYD